MAVAAAVAGAFGFVVFLAAKAPEVETARIARPTGIIFFMISSPFTWKKDAPAVQHKAHISASWSACLRHDTFPLRLPRLRSVSSQLISAIPLLAIRPVDLSFHSTPPGSLSLLQVSTRSEEVQHAALPVLQALAQLPLRHRRLRNRAEAGLQAIWARLAPKEAGASSAECRLLTHAARPYAMGRGQRTALRGLCSGAYIMPSAATMPLVFAPAIRRPQE